MSLISEAFALDSIFDTDSLSLGPLKVLVISLNAESALAYEPARSYRPRPHPLRSEQELRRQLKLSRVEHRSRSAEKVVRSCGPAGRAATSSEVGYYIFTNISERASSASF